MMWFTRRPLSTGDIPRPEGRGGRGESVMMSEWERIIEETRFRAIVRSS
jgi:hypothetical protein